MTVHDMHKKNKAKYFGVHTELWNKNYFLLWIVVRGVMYT